jgi:hypothetical protein
MEKGYFFNAFPDSGSPTGYDRNYNADDFSKWLSVMFTNGVVKTNTDPVTKDPRGLKAIASGGMSVSINAGFACINGKPYANDSLVSFDVATAPTGSETRYDLIVLRMDNSPTIGGRKTTLEYRQGNSSIPDASRLDRTADIWELMLAYIAVKPNATSIGQGEIIDVRGDESVCGWFTAVKGYDDYYDAIVARYETYVTISGSGKVAVTDLPSNLYNGKYSIVSVFTNGMSEKKSGYSVSTDSGFIVVTFNEAKQAGAEIKVTLDNFLDGEGISTALEDYAKWVTAVAELKTANEYNYVCNGVNDNVLLGNIVRAYLQGGSDYGTAKINVIGNIGMTAPAYGSGTASSPYGWFNFNIESNRNVIVDFSRCGQIAPKIEDGTYNVIFHSNNDIHVIGANVIASNSNPNTIIRIVNTSSGVVKFEDCRFYITAYQDSLIGLRGTFINCRGSVANIANNSYCFLPSSNGMVKIIGGEYYAYTSDSTKMSAIVGQSGAEAVSVLYGVSAPTSARSGFYQTNSLIQFAGGGVMNCTDLISELPLSVTAGISNIRGTIAKSKTNVW